MVNRFTILQDLLSSVFNRPGSDDSPADSGSFTELCDALLSERGEVSGNRLSRGLLQRFDAADDAERLAFFELLATRFDVNADHVLRAAQRFANSNSASDLSTLVNDVEPRRQELFRRLNRVPGATVQLVRMRACLLTLMREHPDLARIDLDFRHLFTSWFNRGFLVMREIDWQTPANILKKIIAYEAVHAINSWTALRSRLQPSDRRCFAFFHPAMLDEPLIFVQVALTRESPETVRQVLSPAREILPAHEADTAVFYSISNCQRGLAGVSFGNFLIKQVAKELSSQLPNLMSFRTLSPVPGFMRWVRTQSSDSSLGRGLDVAVRLADEASSTEESPVTVPALEAADRTALQQAVAGYLVDARRGDGQPLDPVARFHLGNGASLDRVLAEADGFTKGLQQSAGAMVSYLYDLDRVDANHQAYASDRTVARSGEVTQLLSQRRPRKLA